MTDQLLTPKDLASRWQLSLSQVERIYRDNRQLAYVRLGRSVRFRMADILAFENLNLKGSK